MEQKKLSPEEIQAAINMMNSPGSHRPEGYDSRAMSEDEMRELQAQRFQRAQPRRE